MHSSSVRTWMGAVSEIARAVNDDRRLDRILGSVAEHACALIGFDYCAVMLAEPGADHVTVAGHHGLKNGYVAMLNEDSALAIDPHDPAFDSPAGRAFRERTTVVVSDTSTARAYGRLSLLAPAQGYRSLLATPLGDADGPRGLLVGYLREPHEFDATDVELAELLADQTAIAIRTAELRAHQQATIAELEEHRAVRDRADQQHRLLMSLVLEDIGLDGLVSALADMLEADVLVEDRAGAVLAATPGHDFRCSAERGRRGHGPGALPHTYEAVPVDGRPPCWVAPVMLGAEVGGHLWVSVADRGLGAAQRAMMERFAVVVGLEMLKRRHVVEVEERLSGDLLSDLLRPDGITHPRSVLDRAAALGGDLTRPHWLAVLTFHGDAGLTPAAAGLVGEAARSVRALSGRYEGHAVLLLPAGAGDPLAAVERVRAAVAPAAAPVEVSALLSSRVDTLAGYAQAYALAAGAARLRRSAGGGRVVDLRSLRLTSLLLLQSTVPQALRDFAAELVQPLRDHDARKGAELVATVRTWLDNGFSVAATARALVVHANTVTYRLSLVEELLGRDVRSADTRLELQLALTVSDVLDLGAAG